MGEVWKKTREMGGRGFGLRDGRGRRTREERQGQIHVRLSALRPHTISWHPCRRTYLVWKAGCELESFAREARLWLVSSL